MRSHGASRVVRLDEQRVLDDPRFQQALHALAEQDRRSVEECENYARKCLAELAVHPQDRYLDYVARLARFMVSRSYAPDLDVNSEALERLKQLAKQHPMIFLWSHKSHLDSFVFMQALYDAHFTPQPLSFAGINMNFAAFGALAKRSGAIFLRRSFKHDAVYKLVLQHYIDYLVAQRVPLSWSIEGTRSRTGMLMPPKLGLIQWVLDAYRRVSCDDVLLVPVAISFDQIAEIDDYVAMQRGLPKRKESLKWFVDYVAGMRVPHGRIFVRFAEPVGLADNVDVSASLLHGESAQIQVQKLAFAVCNRIQRVKPITPIDLLALILLAANGRPLELKQIQDHLLAALAVINDRGLPTAERLDGNDRDGLQAHLSAMIATGLVGELRESATPAYVTTPGQQLAAAYYRNTIAHYFLNGAVAEVALASVSDAPCEQAFWANVMRLRDLLKFDFFFEKKDSFRTDIARLMDHRYPDWRSRANKSFNARPPLFGHSILRSFFATYHIVAALLVARDGASIPAQDRDTMARACLRLGEEMLIRGQLSTATALSLPLLENAIRLADYRQLLQGTAEQLRAARAEFATEVERANAALSQLQEAYDIGFKAG